MEAEIVAVCGSSFAARGSIRIQIGVVIHVCVCWVARSSSRLSVYSVTRSNTSPSIDVARLLTASIDSRVGADSGSAFQVRLGVSIEVGGRASAETSPDIAIRIGVEVRIGVSICA